MKINRIKTPLAALTVAALTAGPASAALVTDWVQILDGQTASTGVTDANTGSPIMGDADAAALAANFPSVTLVDGESLTLTGSVSFDVPLESGQFRWGLFDGDNPPTVGDGAGYVGVNASAADDGESIGFVGFGDGSAGNPFSSSATTSLGSFPVDPDAVLANETLDFLLTITRDGANLDLFASITNNNSFSQSLDLQDQTLNQYTYDTVAFLIGGAMDGTVSTFTDIDVTLVPEPSSIVGGGFLVTLLTLRRQKR